MQAHERNLLRRETALPGFETVLYPEAFAAALHKALLKEGACGAEAVEVGVPKITYLRYKPLTNCLVSYALELGGVPHFAHATAHRIGETAKVQKALETYRGESDFPPLILPGQIVVRFFPTDRKLGALKGVMDASRRAELLERALPEHPALWDADLDIIRYKPERRLVARLSPPFSSPSSAQALLKLYHEGDFERAAAGARAFSNGKRVRTARLLGSLARQQLLIWEWLDARPFDALVQSVPETTVQVGAALAALHYKDAPKEDSSAVLHPIPRPEEGRPLLAAANAVTFLLPKLAERVERLAAGLAADLAAAPVLCRPVHGDFSADQVLIDDRFVDDQRGDRGVVIIDFDAAAQGDPAWDLGTFCAQLEHDVLRGELPSTLAGRIQEHLLAGYEGACGALPERVPLYTAAGLLRLAPHAFRGRASDWAEQTEALLGRAEALLALGKGTAKAYLGSPASARGSEDRRENRSEDRSENWNPVIPVVAVCVTDPYDLPADDALGAQEALRPLTVAPLLEPLLLERGVQATLRAVWVLRHREGRRALIAYDLETDRKIDCETEHTDQTIDGKTDLETDRKTDHSLLRVLGKVRAKGADRKTHALQTALWQSGFDDQSEDGVSVPEPLGVIEPLKLTLQRAVPGETLAAYLTRPESPELMRRVAEVAHKLHCASQNPDVPKGVKNALKPRRTFSLADELEVLHTQLAKVAYKRPDWEARLERILAACKRLAKDIPSFPPTGIHRDFYFDQLLLGAHASGDLYAGRLYLLDLDLYALGDPALDIGNFAAHLSEYALRVLGDADALAPQTRALTERFCALSDVSEAAVEGYHTLSLVRHLAISQRVAARRPSTKALFGFCEARLGLSPPRAEGRLEGRAEDRHLVRSKGSSAP